MTSKVQTTPPAVVQHKASVTEKSVQVQNRLIGTLRLHYDATKNFYNKPATSTNKLLAAAQKTAYVALSAITAVAETLRNILAGLFNVAVFPINFIASKIKTEKSEKVEKKLAEEKPVVAPKAEEKPVVAPKAEEKPVVAPKAEEKPVAALNPQRGAFRKVQADTKYDGRAIASKAYTYVKNHPYRTAASVTGLVATVAAAGYFGPSALSSATAAPTTLSYLKSFIHY